MESSHTNNVKIGHLDSRPAIREELARVYRDMRRGTVNPSDGARLAFVLVSLGKLLEQDTFEAIRNAARYGITEDNGRGRHGEV